MLLLDYPQTDTRYDEKILRHQHKRFTREQGAWNIDTVITLTTDGSYRVSQIGLPCVHFSTLDECLHYLVGGVFYHRKWYEHRASTITA